MTSYPRRRILMNLADNRGNSHESHRRLTAGEVDHLRRGLGRLVGSVMAAAGVFCIGYGAGLAKHDPVVPHDSIDQSDSVLSEQEATRDAALMSTGMEHVSAGVVLAAVGGAVLGWGLRRKKNASRSEMVGWIEYDDRPLLTGMSDPRDGR